jgi:putative nucleotidyltransferase with HDIG domain
MISEYDIEKLFESQLDRIADSELRQKVVSIWVAACAKGRWDKSDQLISMPFTLLTKAHGISFIEHTKAVTDGAVGLAKAMLENYHTMPYRIDMDRLVAGGLLHDVGKLLEIEPISGGGYRKSRSGMLARHPISGALLVGQAGMSEELVNIVACHAKEGEGAPKCIETVLIHQADFATFDPLVMMEKGQLIL